jgi:mono/diheme cytochrome c family protein
MQEHFGEMTYRLFCAGCHGADGRGNREVADALGMSIGDLTQISRRNDGVFPRDEIADAIAGRGPRGHTQLLMAPWADMFADEFEQFATRFIANEMVTRRIEHLTAYLESIQED